MSEATRKTRRNLFEKLLGKDAGNELEAAMEGVRTALDKAGVERKEFDTKKVKGKVEDLQAEMVAALAPFIDDEAQVSEAVNMLLAQFMGTATEIVEELPMEEMPMEEMQDGEEDPTKLPEQFMELAEQVKALASESTDVQNETKKLIPAFIEMAGVVKGLAPLVEKAAAFDALTSRMEAVEKLIALSPRPASTAKETVVQSATVQTELEKSLHGPKTVLGYPVKE